MFLAIGFSCILLKMKEWLMAGNWVANLVKWLLTLFRLAAVIFGIFYIKKIIEKKYNPAFIVCVALIFAGALGNLIDSMFYGLIFEDSTTFPLIMLLIYFLTWVCRLFTWQSSGYALFPYYSNSFSFLVSCLGRAGVCIF